jgi:hypothetical protein
MPLVIIVIFVLAMLYPVTVAGIAKQNIVSNLFKKLHPLVRFHILKALVLNAGDSSLLGYHAMSAGNEHGIPEYLNLQQHCCENFKY